MKLIGFTGPMGSGKDSACDCLSEYLAQQYGKVVRRQGFADRLKLSAARIFFPDIDLHDALDFCNELKHDHTVIARADGYEEVQGDNWRGSVTGRQFLQHYGTEAHRDVFGSNFWVDALLPVGGGDSGEHIKWQANFEGADVAVVTDVRFVNEAARIRELGGDVIRMERRQAENQDAHASEKPVPDEYVNGTIPNHGSVAELRMNVELFAEVAGLSA